MRRFFTFAVIMLLASANMLAQVDDYNEISEDGTITRRSLRKDSANNNSEIPIGIKVWTVDPKFGERRAAELDTLPYMYMNSIFTTGLRGEYNTTGNLGAPRINRIFIDRPEAGQFIFTQPYDFILTQIGTFHFTNTLSPFTNISYNSAGNRTNGEDHFKAKFGVNAGKRIGVGFLFDYIYGRGYYQYQSTSHFNYTMYGSYIGEQYQAHLVFSTLHEKVAENGGITNDEYITHPESFDDSYSTSEIPTVLTENWNRNDNLHVFLTHRYSLGFNRKVKMTDDEIKARKFAIESQRENDALRAKEEASRQARREGREFDEEQFDREGRPAGRPDDARIAGDEPAPGPPASSDRITVDSETVADSLLSTDTEVQVDTMWMKNEYVPVTSFIHTLSYEKYKRIYQAYDVPDDFYAETYDDGGYYEGDSIYDKTTHFQLQNIFAISLLEGFNKWAKAGVKVFMSSDLRHFVLPALGGGWNTYNEHNLSVGGQLSKTLGRTLHYDVIGEAWLSGKDAGQVKIDATADVNFALLGDTMTLAAKGFFHHSNPTFYYRHYHSSHLWWDNDDMDKIIHSRVEGLLSFPKTHTRLRVAFDEIKNYTYFGMSYAVNDDYDRTSNTVSVRQHSGAITLFTMSLDQDFRLGPLHWENVVTFQKSSESDVLPVPDLNIYSNLYLRFKIAGVLRCDFGGDVRYFTKYYAPDYSPTLGQYAVQEGDNRTEVGNYPYVNVYANFHLKHTRFFVMMSHVNAGNGNKSYFLTPHYPLNERIFRFGLSWNFFN